MGVEESGRNGLTPLVSGVVSHPHSEGFRFPTRVPYLEGPSGLWEKVPQLSVRVGSSWGGQPLVGYSSSKREVTHCGGLEPESMIARMSLRYRVPLFRISISPIKDPKAAVEKRFGMVQVSEKTGGVCLVCRWWQGTGRS